MADIKDETGYKKALIKSLQYSGWSVWKHEDKVDVGVPDLYFSGFKTEGWIEVKWLNSPVLSLGHIRHYTQVQESRLKAMGTTGSGNCFLWVGSPWGHFIWKHNSLGKGLNALPFDDAAKKCFIPANGMNLELWRVEWAFTNKIVVGLVPRGGEK